MLRQATRIGLAQLVLVEAAVILAWPLGLDGLLDHEISLLVALLLSLAFFMGAECVRGVLSGRHEFNRYRTYFAAEGAARLLMAAVLAIVGIEAVGAYATAIAFAFAVATVVAVGALRPFVKPGPPAPLGEVTPALGWLLVTSLSEAFLLNVGPVALEIVGDDLGEEVPGVFLNGHDHLAGSALLFPSCQGGATSEPGQPRKRRRPQRLPRLTASTCCRSGECGNGLGGGDGIHWSLAGRVFVRRPDRLGRHGSARSEWSRPDDSALAVAGARCTRSRSAGGCRFRGRGSHLSGRTDIYQRNRSCKSRRRSSQRSAPAQSSPQDYCATSTPYTPVPVDSPNLTQGLRRRQASSERACRGYGYHAHVGFLQASSA